MPAPRVNDVVRGRRAISADTALRLGIYFGLPAQFWLNRQNDYDLRLAAKASALQKISPRAKAAPLKPTESLSGPPAGAPRRVVPTFSFVAECDHEESQLLHQPTQSGESGSQERRE